VDACVPYLGTMRWVADVAQNTGGHPWPVVGDAWVSWTVDDNVAGYFTAYDVNSLGDHNFTFATVKGAGHMVPEVKPKSALSLFYRFLNNIPMDYVEPSVLTITTQPSPDSPDVTHAVGETFTLTIAVEGGSPASMPAIYTFQWFKDGNAVPGYSDEVMLTVTSSGEAAPCTAVPCTAGTNAATTEPSGAVPGPAEPASDDGADDGRLDIVITLLILLLVVNLVGIVAGRVGSRGGVGKALESSGIYQSSSNPTAHGAQIM
jgi:hypothetical protein